MGQCRAYQAKTCSLSASLPFVLVLSSVSISLLLCPASLLSLSPSRPETDFKVEFANNNTNNVTLRENAILSKKTTQKPLKKKKKFICV